MDEKTSPMRWMLRGDNSLSITVKQPAPLLPATPSPEPLLPATPSPEPLRPAAKQPEPLRPAALKPEPLRPAANQPDINKLRFKAPSDKVESPKPHESISSDYPPELPQKKISKWMVFCIIMGFIVGKYLEYKTGSFGGFIVGMGGWLMAGGATDGI